MIDTYIANDFNVYPKILIPIYVYDWLEIKVFVNYIKILHIYIKIL